MFENTGDFSQSDLARMLRQPEARALLARLQELDQSALQRAVDLAFHGNAQGAREALTPLLADDTVRQLSERMRDSNGRI